MKANKYYTESKTLTFMNMEIDAKQCSVIKIAFTIDIRHILLAITCMSDDDIKQATRTSVEKQLRQELFYKGDSWSIGPMEYGEEGNHYNLRENLKEVLPIGKALFPEFFNTPNSVKFIKDLE